MYYGDPNILSSLACSIAARPVVQPTGPSTSVAPLFNLQKEKILQ